MGSYFSTASTVSTITNTKISEVKTFPDGRNGIICVTDSFVTLLFSASQVKQLTYADDIKDKIKKFLDDANNEHKGFTIAYHNDTIYSVGYEHETIHYSGRLTPSSLGGGIVTDD